MPHTIDKKAFLILMSNSAAINAPVHAPVPGRGIATNKYNPKFLYLNIFSLFSIALFSILYINFTNLVFLKSQKIFLIKSK